MNDRPPRPDALDFRPEGVADELTDTDLWLVWKYEWRQDREEWSKVPKDGSGGDYRIDATDPDNGVAFEEALETYEDGDYDGLGLITDPNDLRVGLDFDDCRDPEEPGGSVPSAVGESIADLETYTEVSPSGTGFRAFARGAKPEGKNRADLPCDPVIDDVPHLEMYDGSGGRYLTVTGHHVEKTPKSVETRPQEIKEIYEEFIEENDANDGEVDGTQSEPQPVDFDHRELLEKAKNAKNGEKFRRLWNGDISKYSNDDSRADMALCSLLAYWTGGDRRRMDKLFRESGLMRDKWDRDDYRKGTIEKAIKGRSEFYEPQGSETPPTDPPDGSSTWDHVRSLYKHDESKQARKAAVEALEQKTAWMYVLDSEVLWVYDDEKGYFNRWGNAVAARMLERQLRTNYSKHERREIVDRIQVRNQTQRDELNAGTRDGHYVCVGNGVIDLESGELMDHSPEFKFTRGLKWDYDPERANPEPVLSFLDDITEREADRDTLLDHLAHGLMPGHPFRAFVITYGPGSNGKTQMGQLFRGFVGEENAASVELQDLTGDDSFATGGLPGAFVNVGDDISVGSIRDTSILKSLTGSGTIRANEKYEKQYEFENEAAMFFSANEPPRIAEESDAIGDRLYPIRMPYRFVDDGEYDADNPYHKRKEPGISERLLSHDEAMRGLLALCVEHAQELIASNGQYSMPEGPKERRAAYESASDPILRFVIEYLKQGSEEDALLKEDAYSIYTEMCEVENERIAREDTFKRKITQQSLIDVEAGETRTLTPDSDRDYCWKYLAFSDDAKELMPPRLVARYFGDDEETDEEEMEPASTNPTFSAVPIPEAAQSLTGYVTVTAEVVRTERLGDEEKGLKAILKDEEGAIDLVAWDESYATRFEELEGETIVVREAEVTEYDGKRQLSPVDGLTEIQTIQRGVAHTENETTDDGQNQLPEGSHSEETVADGGEVPEDASGLLADARRLADLLNSNGKPMLKGELVAAATEEKNMTPTDAENAITYAVEEKGMVVETADGYVTA